MSNHFYTVGNIKNFMDDTYVLKNEKMFYQVRQRGREDEAEGATRAQTSMFSSVQVQNINTNK